MVTRKLKVKQTRKVKIFWWLIVSCLIIFGIIIFLSFREFGPEVDSPPQQFFVADECSLVMGNIIHPMKNDADCKIRCRGECDVREMEFINHSFSEKVNSCHECSCYCG